MTDINIFNKNYKDSLVFTKLENSTCSLQIKLSNIKFKEEDLIHKLRCEGSIVAIDCNYGHIRMLMYEPPTKNKISNRGRKKIVKKKENRRNQGDGTCFGSQISFVIVNEMIRKIPHKHDNYSATAIKIDDEYESILKEYKIKLFRNGVGGVPGVLKEDYSDAMPPINKLVTYLNEILKPPKRIELVKVEATMKNYKFKLLGDKLIDIRRLHYYCNSHFIKLYNTNFTDIFKFLTNPIMINKNPNRFGWNKYVHKKKFEINWDKLYPYLDRVKSAKNIYVDKNILLQEIKKVRFEQYYMDIIGYLKELKDYFLIFDDRIMSALIRIKIAPRVFELKKRFEKMENNSLSSIQYDKENYPGFLIKITTPTLEKPNKKTTIKIFPGGKINIDGARDRKTAEQIYYWLNHMFYKNKDLMYEINYVHNETDSEFSEDSSSN